jgi:hypothetical protein
MTQKKSSKAKVVREVTLDGLMTIGQLDNGLHEADFKNCEEGVHIDPFRGKCMMQLMRDGNVYITELPKRIRNAPLFREDHSSLSLGRDEWAYFVYRQPVEQLAQVPENLLKEALAIGKKIRKYIEEKGKQG